MTKKPPPISQEERDEFRKHLSNTTPLNQPNKEPKTTPSKPFKIRGPFIDDTSEAKFELSNEDSWHEAQDCIHFAHSGVQQRFLSKFRRGQIQIQATLDLHQMDRMEAGKTIDQFLNRMQSQGYKTVLIIHGKGLVKPVLKNLVNQYLRQDRRVLAFHSATPKHGGTGAVYVLIKSK